MDEDEFSTNSSPSAFGDLEGDSLTTSKTGTIAYPDPIADTMLYFYKKFYLEDSEMTRFVILAAPVGAILFFYMFVSQTLSSVISFSAFIISLVFIGISIMILCEILKKDVGPRGM